MSKTGPIHDAVQAVTDLYVNRLELLRAAAGPKIGWLSIDTPEEILLAAGAVPFRLTGEAGTSTDEAGARLSQEAADAKLLATIKARLIREPDLDGFDINVDVEQGRVTLRGTIPSETARVQAIKIARETAGVKGIRSELVLKRPGQP